MTKLVLEGKIEESYFGDNYNALFIGSKVVARELERFSSWSRIQVNCVYALSDRYITKADLLEIAINQATGICDAEYSDHYSELTGYLWTDENGRIGGHDIVRLFRNNLGKFAVLVVDTEPIDLMELAS